MTIPNRSEVEQKLASFEGCTPVAWLCTKTRRKWNSTGTEHTNETEEERQVWLSEERANWLVQDSGYIKTPLYATPQLVEWVRELSADLSAADQINALLRVENTELRAERDRLSAQLSAQSSEVELYITALDEAKECKAAQSERIAALEKEKEEHIELMDGFRKLYSRAWQEIPKSLQDELAAEALHLITHRRANAARLDARGGIERIEPKQENGT